MDGVDAIIVDVGLPDGSGITLVEEARRAEPRPACVLVSASVDRARLSAANELGVQYLLKPVDASQLELVIERARAARAAPRERLQPTLDVWARRYGLTPALLEILTLAAEGHPRAALPSIRGVFARDRGQADHDAPRANRRSVARGCSGPIAARDIGAQCLIERAVAILPTV